MDGKVSILGKIDGYHRRVLKPVALLKVREVKSAEVLMTYNLKPVALLKVREVDLGEDRVEEDEALVVVCDFEEVEISFINRKIL